MLNAAAAIPVIHARQPGATRAIRAQRRSAIRVTPVRHLAATHAIPARQNAIPVIRARPVHVIPVIPVLLLAAILVTRVALATRAVPVLQAAVRLPTSVLCRVWPAGVIPATPVQPPTRVTRVVDVIHATLVQRLVAIHATPVRQVHAILVIPVQQQVATPVILARRQTRVIPVAVAIPATRVVVAVLLKLPRVKLPRSMSA